MTRDTLRWLIVTVLVLAVVGLLAYARGEPGDDGRMPDPPTASASPAQGDTPAERAV